MTDAFRHENESVRARWKKLEERGWCARTAVFILAGGRRQNGSTTRAYTKRGICRGRSPDTKRAADEMA